MKKIVLTLGIITTGMLVGCQEDNSAKVNNDVNSTKVLNLSSSSDSTVTSDEGYALTSSIWDRRNLTVCWVDNTTDPAILHGREVTRNAIGTSWSRYSNLSITGWGSCSDAPNSDIKIRVIDDVNDGPSVNGGLGSKMKDMDLNFTFNNWSPACKKDATTQDLCIKSIATHEFGHALGFAHEQNRPDTPNTCEQPAQGTNGNVMVGAWDISSVMNYCNKNYNGNGILSDTDKVMVQTYYGHNPDCERDNINYTDGLQVGQVMCPGDTLKSKNGNYLLAMQYDGNLVVYAPNNKPIWASSTVTGGATNRAKLNADGNFVIYNKQDTPVFTTGTSDTGSQGYLAMQEDGNLVIYNSKRLWSSQPSLSDLGNDEKFTMPKNAGLSENQSIVSPNGIYRFVMQGDGNGVIYNNQNTPLFDTKTHGQPGPYNFVMQQDGNLVLYSNGRPVFSSNTAGAFREAELHNDGQLGIWRRGPTWSTYSGILN